MNVNRWNLLPRRFIPASLTLLASLSLTLGAPAKAGATEVQGEQFLSICNQETTLKARPRLCNTSPLATRFDVVLLGLPPGTISSGVCTLAGPTSLHLEEARPVLVPGASCVDLHITVDRPAGMDLDDTSCFAIQAKDLNTDQTYEAKSLISDGGETCGRTSDATSTGLPDGQQVPMAFTVRNMNPQPETFEFELVPMETPGEDPVVTLNGGPAGAAVTGQVVVPAFGQNQVAAEVAFSEESDSTQNLLLVDRNSHTVLASRGFATFTQGCVANATTLCLNQGRFEVKAMWRDFAGHTGVGHAGDITADTGYFWFFSPDNIEVVLKVLDGRTLNQKWWVFFGALSTVEYTLTVRDTWTGESKSYNNPSGVLASVGDISALPGYDPVSIEPLLPAPEGLDETSLEAALAELDAAPQAATDACIATATSFCVQGGRFRVEASWTTATSSGVGHASVLTYETGYFWFFSHNNVEVVLKVLDGRSINGHWWVFFGALSDVDYTVTVTDTATGNSNTYHNRQGQLASVADLGAFQ